jgi:hypothetical protein
MTTQYRYIEFLDRYFEDMINDEKREIIIQTFWRCFGLSLRHSREIVNDYWIAETKKRVRDAKRQR